MQANGSSGGSGTAIGGAQEFSKLCVFGIRGQGTGGGICCPPYSCGGVRLLYRPTDRDRAAAAGVRVAVETVSVHPICSPEKTWRLLDDVGSANLDVILDPVNLMHTEDDPNVNEYVKQTLRLYGDRVIAVHWKHPEAKRDDPALVFAARGEQTVVITEGLTDENLSKVIEQLKTI